MKFRKTVIKRCDHRVQRKNQKADNPGRDEQETSHKLATANYAPTLAFDAGLKRGACNIHSEPHLQTSLYTNWREGGSLSQRVEKMVGITAMPLRVSAAI